MRIHLATGATELRKRVLHEANSTVVQHGFIMNWTRGSVRSSLSPPA
jgi:hypothetical protein